MLKYFFFFKTDFMSIKLVDEWLEWNAFIQNLCQDKKRTAVYYMISEAIF